MVLGNGKQKTEEVITLRLQAGRRKMLSSLALFMKSGTLAHGMMLSTLNYFLTDYK